MFDKIKSIAMNILGIDKFDTKDGRVVFSGDQRAKLVSQFGNDFIEKFTASLEKELADTSAQERADAMQQLTESMKTETAKQIEANKVQMQKELAEKLEAQTKIYNQKLEALSRQAEDDQEATQSDTDSKFLKTFKINPAHAHNRWAKAMMQGSAGADIMMGDTIDITDLKTEFGTFISQTDKPILKKLTQPTETMKYMTTKVAITEWRASRALIDSVVQQFSSKWTPLGASDFTPMKIKNYRHKINVPITPDEINDSWLSHLYDETLTPEAMPITKYIINELILPKVEEDREMLLIANGVYTELVNPVTGNAGQATGQSMDGFITQLVKLYETKATNNINFIPLGPVNTANIVDKIEEFVDAIDPLYARKSMNIFISETIYKKYKRAYRDLYPTTKNVDNSDLIDYSLQKLQPLPSMYGSPHFFTTPKDNFIRLIHKNQGASKIFMQTEDYDVKVFAEWWEGCGFAIQEAVYAYIDSLSIIDGYAKSNDATNLQTYMLTDAGATNVYAANLEAYKVAIAAETSINSLVALQTIITSTNLTALGTAAAALLTIQGYATNSDASLLTIQQLVDAGATGTVPANLEAYKVAIAAEASINSLVALQTIITSTNAAAALLTIQGYATGSDASLLTIQQLVDAGATGTVPANLEAYKVAIAAAESIANLAALQTIITSTNASETAAAALLTIQGYATGSDASLLTIQQLVDAGATGTVPEKLASYKVAIAAETSIADLAALQVIVDAVNSAE